MACASRAGDVAASQGAPAVRASASPHLPLVLSGIELGCFSDHRRPVATQLIAHSVRRVPVRPRVCGVPRTDARHSWARWSRCGCRSASRRSRRDPRLDHLLLGCDRQGVRLFSRIVPDPGNLLEVLLPEQSHVHRPRCRAGPPRICARRPACCRSKASPRWSEGASCAWLGCQPSRPTATAISRHCGTTSGQGC